jgi:hypothetical protein
MGFIPFHKDYTHECLEDLIYVHHFLVEGGSGLVGTWIMDPRTYVLIDHFIVNEVPKNSSIYFNKI